MITKEEREELSKLIEQAGGGCNFSDPGDLGFADYVPLFVAAVNAAPKLLSALEAAEARITELETTASEQIELWKLREKEHELAVRMVTRRNAEIKEAKARIAELEADVAATEGSANFQKMAREAHVAMNDHAVHQTEKNRLRILATALEEAFQLGVESVRRGREQSALLAKLPLPPVIIDAKGRELPEPPKGGRVMAYEFVTVRFRGESDDTFGYEILQSRPNTAGVGSICTWSAVDDFDNSASGAPIRWRITHKTEHGDIEELTVVGVYGVTGPAWTIGVSGIDGTFADWFTIFEKWERHSPTLNVTIPFDAEIICVERNAEKGGA